MGLGFTVDFLHHLSRAGGKVIKSMRANAGGLWTVPVCYTTEWKAWSFPSNEMWISHSTTHLSIWKPGALMN